MSRSAGAGERKSGVLRRGHEQQPLAQRLQPLEFPDHHVNVAPLPSRQRAGQQLGVAERDRDRRPELVRRVLQELPLDQQEPLRLGRDPGPLPRGHPAVGLPGEGDEYGGEQRQAGPDHVVGHDLPRGEDHDRDDADQPEQQPGELGLGDRLGRRSGRLAGPVTRRDIGGFG